MHQTIDTSAELIISRHRHGVKLTRPNYDESGVNSTHIMDLTTAMQLPFNVYFLDIHHHIMAINDASWQSCTFQSQADAIGSSIAKVCHNQKQVTQLFAHDTRVLQTGSMHIFDESIDLVDNKSMHCISLRIPWLNESSIPLGIFGVSIVLPDDVLSHVAHQLAYISRVFLSQPLVIQDKLRCTTIASKYFSAQEREIIHWVMRGKTLRAIAAIMGLSPRTVEAYFANIKTKANVRSKSEFIEKALEHVDWCESQSRHQP